MNIDKFIFPKFKRFDSMNLGLKRLLFLLSFPPTVILTVGFVFALTYNSIVVPHRKEDPVAFFIPIFIVIAYILFWVIVRLFFWTYDGFIQNSNNRK